MCPPCTRPVLTPLFTLVSLQSSLSNGDKGRPADYLSNGKKRKADEKEFMTDYVRLFHNTVSATDEVSPTSPIPRHTRPMDCVDLQLFHSVIEIFTLLSSLALLW